MGSLKGVDIQKGSVGPNASGPDTSPSGLIGNFVPVAGTFVAGTVYTVTSVKQAEALGITSTYDITSDQVCYQHIVDFFSMAGEGTTLYLMTTGIAITPAVALEDLTGIYAKKMLIFAKGNIRQIGVAYNVAAADTETLVDGMNANIRAAIPKAQLLAEWAYDTDRPIRILLEGRRMSDTLTAAINLRNIDVSGTVLEAPNVTVIAGQDWGYAEARKIRAGIPAGSKVHYYAAVGKALGTLAAAEMNQSIAEVATFNISDATRGYFITAGLSNHLKTADQETYLNDLDTKGYVFPISFPSESGYRWNNDHTCVEIRVDADGNINEHMIYYGRTLDEAARALKAAFVKRLKQRVAVDTATGKLPLGVLTNLEAEGDIVFNRMSRDGYISGGQTIVDPDSDLITAPKSLLVSFKLVPTAILDNVSGTINLVKSFQL